MKLTLNTTNICCYSKDIPLVIKLNEIIKQYTGYEINVYVYLNSRVQLRDYTELDIIIRRPGSSLGCIVPKYVDDKLYVDKILMNEDEIFPDNTGDILTAMFKDYEIEIDQYAMGY